MERDRGDAGDTTKGGRMTTQTFIIDLLAGACLYAAIIIAMRERPFWQRVTVFLLLLFGIMLLIAASMSTGKAG